MKRLYILLVITALFSSKAWADGLCTDALVRSTLSTSSSVRTDWRLATLVSEGEWNEASHKGGVSAVIYGVPVGASYQDFKSRVSQLTQTYNESLSTEQLYNLAWTGLDPNSVDAYKSCLDSLQLGLLVAVRSATPSTISLLVRYNGTGNEPPGPVTVQWVPPTIEGVTLDTSVPQGGNGHTIQVPRPQTETVLYANYGGVTSPGVYLGPLPPPPPPLPTQQPITDALQSGKTCIVRLQSTGPPCLTNGSGGRGGLAINWDYPLTYSPTTNGFKLSGPLCQLGSSQAVTEYNAALQAHTISLWGIVFHYDENGSLTVAPGENAGYPQAIYFSGTIKCTS